ncbi:S-2-hydroxy-acid oxidase [Nymphaea thermarum]|nr:S-2-hydroxy-acid oxidase [Nymphaea thermarum]
MTTWKAIEVGVDGIIVSNHDGHQIGCAPAAISALEEMESQCRGKKRGGSAIKAQKEPSSADSDAHTPHDNSMSGQPFT